MADKIVDELLGSAEPSIRWMLRTRVLGESPDSRSIGRLRDEISRSPRVQTLLAGVRKTRPTSYAKWQGAHWVLASLAELGYPPGDTSLEPECSEVLKTWLSASFFQEFVAESKAAAYRRTGVPVIDGRHRRCASQQGSALLSATRLGLVDQEQAGALVERLLHWQWPDGGWNCDKRPEAHMSSIYETVLPMRGLAALDLLESKRLADGGWPAERRHWRRVSPDVALYNEHVEWGPVTTSRRNPWVTADAAVRARSAGRLPR